MLPDLAVLNAPMKIADVLSYCHKNALCIYVGLPSTQKLSEFKVFFPKCEGSFCLDTSVDSELDAFIAGYPRKTFFALPFELPGDSQSLLPFLFRDLPVLAFQTFRPVRAIAAFIAVIYCFFSNVPAAGLSVMCSAGIQAATIFTCIEVAVIVVRHVLSAADV